MFTWTYAEVLDEERCEKKVYQSWQLLEIKTKTYKSQVPSQEQITKRDY